MIPATCPGCSITVNVADTHAGKSAKCKRCGEKFRVPVPNSAFEVTGDAIAVQRRDTPLVVNITKEMTTSTGMEWWIKVRGETYGPYSLTAMKEFAEIERINGTSLVAEHQAGPFYKASKIKAFFTNVAKQEEYKHDAYGAWCPNCRNRCSQKASSGGGCLFFCFIFVSMGFALLLVPFLPKEWKCNQCQHRWRA